MAVDQDEIHRLSLNVNRENRLKVAKLLKEEFNSLPDKPSAWADLVRLTSDEDSVVRKNAVFSLGSAFSSLPEEYKSSAWADLLRLINDGYADVSWHLVFVVGSAFFSITDKSAAWSDLHQLTNDKNSDNRNRATSVIYLAFPHLPDKSSAWFDLIRLSNDEDLYVRGIATIALGYAFMHVPDKSAAWDDLHRLTNDENSDVRESFAFSLGYVFVYAPDKSAAWSDLHRLTNDKNSDVRVGAAFSLGYAFMHAPDKSCAWDDLYRLTSDEDSNVRMRATHSMGKICIYKASKSENESDARAFLEEAIQYFEKASKEGNRFNPAQFCYPFYRSFDAVVFKKVQSKTEIEDYIAVAKKEIEESKSKQKLMEMIELLAEALETAINIKKKDINEQELLKYCSDICNQADYLMSENKEKIPIFFELYKNTMPYFRKAIKDLIDEVKEKAEIACREAKGEYRQAACALKRDLDALSFEESESLKQLDDILYIALGRTGVLKGLEGLHDKIKDAIESKEKRQKLEALKMYAEGLNPQPTMLSKIVTATAIAGFIYLLAASILELDSDFPNKTESILVLTIGTFVLTLIIEW